MLKTSTRMAPGVRGALFAMVPLAVPSASFAADELLPIEQRGQAVLAEFCGSCHAIGRTEESPNPAAPPFRTIDRRFPIETLRQKMEEGLIMSGHPDMPTFRFRREDIRPVIAYLLAIQKD